jgi:hypothetical protein
MNRMPIYFFRSIMRCIMQTCTIFVVKEKKGLYKNKNYVKNNLVCIR